MLLRSKGHLQIILHSIHRLLLFWDFLIQLLCISNINPLGTGKCQYRCLLFRLCSIPSCRFRTFRKVSGTTMVKGRGRFYLVRGCSFLFQLQCNCSSKGTFHTVSVGYLIELGLTSSRRLLCPLSAIYFSKSNEKAVQRTEKGLWKIMDLNT